MAALGLRSGQGAEAYVWAEADPDVRGLLRAYPDAAMLRRVAAIIRGWADEEPRALWERLRAERKARGPRVDEEGMAGWIVSQGWSPDGRYMGPDRPSSKRETDPAWVASITAGGMTDRCLTLAESRWPPVAVLPTIPTAAELAALVGTPGDLDGVICYQDPPYLNTTGYAHDLPRADVVRFAVECAALGAVVCVSEATPVDELTALGWAAVEITAGRKGQVRTFSAQKREWLTMNREPAHRVATQSALFTLGAP